MTSFDLNKIIIFDSNDNDQNYDITNTPFEIVNPKLTRLKHNGNNWFQRALNAFRG